MGVDVLLGAFILSHELIFYVFLLSLRCLLSLIIWEGSGDVSLLDLLIKQVDFVQEKDDGCLHKPFAVANLLEKLEGFVHSVSGVVFE
jgi:hypothetical protein